MICTVAGAIFLLVASASWLVGRAVQAEATEIAQDTIPGLANSAAALSVMQENWLRVHLVGHLGTAAERAALVQKVRANSNDELWRQYGQAVFSTDDRRNFEAMLAARTNYLDLREEFFTHILAGRLAEAQALQESRLSPAYERYKTASQSLFVNDARLGRERAAKVMRSSGIMPFIFGAFGVVVFGFGVLVGLRGAFVGMDLVSLVRKR